MSYPLENALFQWEEGWRVLQGIEETRERRRAERVVGAVEDELRRRVGPTFRAAELADLYGRGTDWCLQIALESAPAPRDRSWHPGRCRLLALPAWGGRFRRRPAAGRLKRPAGSRDSVV